MADFKRKDAQKLAYRVVEMIEVMRTEMAGQDAAIQRQAAEIERLRAAGDALVAAIRNHDLTQSHIKAWEEARRG